MICVEIFARQGPLDLHIGDVQATLQEGSNDAPSEIDGSSPLLSPGDTFFGGLDLGDIDVVEISLIAGEAYTFRIDSGSIAI